MDRRAFSAAARGVVVAWRQERHVRFHVWATYTIGLVAWAVRLTPPETLWLLATVSAVIALELVNSAIERAVDLQVGKQWHPLAGLVKDMAAGAVLVLVVQAVVGGVLLFIVWRSPLVVMAQCWALLVAHPLWNAGWLLLTGLSLWVRRGGPVC